MRGRTVVFGLLGAAIVASGGVVAGLSVAGSGRIADGMHVHEVQLGGLTAEQAKARLERELLEPLRRPIVVTRRGREHRLSAKEAKITADIDAAVDEAVERSREVDPFTEAWRTVSGTHPSESIPVDVEIDRDATLRFVDRVRREVDRKVREPRLAFDGDRPVVEPGRNGLETDRKALARLVEELAGERMRSTRLVPVRETKPKFSTKAFKRKTSTVITVNRTTNTLRLYKNLKQDRKYTVAVGAQGHETPAGTYAITNKQVDPTWHVPMSDWAGDMAGKIVPPGPSNPLKARWMGFYDGAGIHGTADRGSIGSNASHGCVRMLVEDVIDLYDRVPVGTPIHIV